MLKNWVTESLIVTVQLTCNFKFQLYVKELSNWNCSEVVRSWELLKFQLYVKELSNWNLLRHFCFNMSIICFNYMLKNWVTETFWLYTEEKMDLLGFNYMLKNWVTETCKLLLSRLRVQRGFNYMLKNWVTET